MHSVFLYLSCSFIIILCSACESTPEMTQATENESNMGMVSISVNGSNGQSDRSVPPDLFISFDQFSSPTDSIILDQTLTDLTVHDQFSMVEHNIPPSLLDQSIMMDVQMPDLDIETPDLDIEPIDLAVIEDQALPIEVDLAFTTRPPCDPLVGCIDDGMTCLGDTNSRCLGGIDENCRLQCTAARTTTGCGSATYCESRILIRCQNGDRWRTLACEREQRCIDHRRCQVLPEIYGQVCTNENTEACREAGLECGGWSIALHCLHPNIRISQGRAGDECYTAQDCWMGYLCNRAGYCTEGKVGDSCLEDEDCLDRCDRGVCSNR